MNWREQGPEIRTRILFDLQADMAERLQVGAERYPGDFEGDPLGGLYEEILDQVYYHYYTRRQVAALEARIRELEPYYKALKEWAGTDLTAAEVRGRLGLEG